ncbi:MAG TPA: hypothetical protein VHX39_16615 [Acetobacteraceae bacterium]|jgi:hypothetical protein|nr:hypothetical protein [Acetobacteraceae bacterium]
MQALKIVTIVMGVLIVLGTTVVVVTVVRRTMFGPAGFPEKAFAATLDEPAGTGILGVTSVRDRLAVQLHGGGADRVVLIDPVSGVVVGRISLAR